MSWASRRAGPLARYAATLPPTEDTYVGWIKRYIWFHNNRQPKEMGASEVEPFLSSLATQHGVSASTQNQGLCALVFLCKAAVV
nr:site-specific integrase [Candidatus Thiodictyon syntrophicum]